jgi:phosphatidate cytidylyltransferase
MSLWGLIAGTFAALTVATIVGQVLRGAVITAEARRTIQNMNLRIAAWWVLCGLMALALWLGDAAVLALFAVFSLLALREFLSLIPSGHALFRELAAFVPLHYWLLGSRRASAFAILIPLGGLLYIAVRQKWSRGLPYLALVLCVYLPSYAPAVLMLAIPGYVGGAAILLFYLLVVVESSDVLQYVWGKLAGRTPLAPAISPHKTREGAAGGILTAIALGTALYRATPFSLWQAAMVSTAITLAGLAGGLTLSAIKRNRGVKDFGTIVPGHGGVLDRMDSICFAAPVFFCIVRAWFAR